MSSDPQTTRWRPIATAPAVTEGPLIWLRDLEGTEALGRRVHFHDAGWAIAHTRRPIRPVQWMPRQEPANAR